MWPLHELATVRILSLLTVAHVPPAQLRCRVLPVQPLYHGARQQRLQQHLVAPPRQQHAEQQAGRQDAAHNHHNHHAGEPGGGPRAGRTHREDPLRGNEVRRAASQSV